MASDVMGRVYILKFEPPFKHALYYVGWCGERGLFKRLEQHRKGQGAIITRRAVEAGHRLVLVYDAPGTRADERRIKNHGGARRTVERLERHGQLNSQRITGAYKNGRDNLPAPLSFDELMRGGQ